uniref:Ras-associating domain-containing protein n=1 Tax=Panagrolaimus sp. PS1159 TaxID=55785 RepID=A0AC35G119_9BILA
MGLKVISGGIELNVSGVNESTTCLQVVYALAHATNQKGKFILIAHSNETEHRLSHHEKPLEIVNQCSKENIPVTFELRHLNNQQIQPQTSSANMSNTSCAVSAMYSTSLQSYSHGHLPEPFSQHNNIPSASQPSYSSSLKTSGKTASLPPSAFKTTKSLELQTKPRPPPPTYTQVIGERCNSLSRDMSKTMIAALTANRRLILNSLRNANWPLRLIQEEQEGERLNLAIEDMRTFVDRRKNELMGLLQLQHSLENQIENIVGYSDAETVSQPDDTQYCSINDYAIP